MQPRIPTWLRASLSACVFLASCLALPAQTTAQGTVAGRVFNASNNAAVRNVRVTVTGAREEALTSDDGSYVIGGVPAGEATVNVTYLGFESQSATVTVTAGQTAQRDFDLQFSGSAAKSSGGTVTLEKFTVVADQEMSAQAIALNERKSAPNIKQVVAYDEFGDRGDENIGEFLRFLPGVSIEDGGQIASSLSLRGFPAQYSPILMDGTTIAGARGNSRGQSLLDVSMGNMSRVEITKVPTPDMPATGLGGTVNLVTKSGLETRKPVYNYQVYFITDGHTGLTLDGGPRGLSKGLSPKTQLPSGNFNALIPLTKNFAISFGGSSTWRLKPMERDNHLDTQADWNLVSGVQRVSTFYSLDNILTTWSGQFGFGWKLSPEDTLTFGLSHRFVSNNIMRNIATFTYGAGATGDRTFTQGATANGSVTQGAGTNQETGSDTTHSTLKYTHLGRVWRAEANLNFSNSETYLDDIDNGHFNAATITAGSLRLRGEGIGESETDIPVRYSATNAAGTPVNIYDGSNYVITNVSSAQNHILAKKYGGHVDLSREFDTAVPFSLKTGFYWDRLERSQRATSLTWSFNPNGLTTAAARTATNFDIFDEDYLKTAPTIFGAPMRWVALTKLYDLYKQHPDWFVLDQAGAYTNLVNNSRRLIETISAGYIRGDLKLMQNRLWLVGGVRFEHTEEDGYGPLNDPTAQYQKDASGNLILVGGQPVLITTDALARAKLRYKERGARSRSSYGDFYPSLNVTYRLMDDLYLRAAYARTIGRPNYDDLIPGAVIADVGAANPTITVNNAALKPLTADSFDLSIESYQIKGGQGAIGVFRKNISDFVGSLTQDATPELLAFYGLPADPLYLNYDIITKMNVGDATMTGYEFSYTQSLYFLPRWAQGFQVFVNGTKLDIDSTSSLADFTGFAPEKYSGGINYVRPRFFIKLNFTYQGETRGAAVAASAANGIPDGTYDYQGERFRVGINVQYSLSKRFVLFGSMTDINGPGFLVQSRRFADGTRDDLRDRRRQDLGSTIMLGVKGKF